MKSIILLNLVGSVVSTATPTVQVAQQVTKTYEFTDGIPAGTLKNHYSENLQGFLSFVEDGNKCFKDFNVDLKDATKYFENHQEEAIKVLHQTNIDLGKRGLFSWIGSAFKTIGGAIATAVTLGQVDSVKEFTVDSWHESLDQKITGDDLLHVFGGVAKAAGDLMETLKGDGEAAAGLVDGIDDIISH